MKNLLSVTTIAGIVTFGLFVFMAYLVKNQGGIDTEPVEPPVISVYQTPKELKVQINDTKPTPPPMPEATPPVPRVQSEPVEGPVYNAQGPELDFTQGLVDFGLAAPKDDYASPVFRASPKYPNAAASEGTEGWVALSFDVDKTGAVYNINVVDAEPKRVFNRSAINALKKWKYRPKVENGEPVEQTNLMVKLDFNLQQS